MKRPARVIARNAGELVRVLALDLEDAIEIEVRSSLVDRITAAVAERRLTHARVAKLAHTSRALITAILNRNTEGVSTDLLLRILGRLGYRTRIVVTRAA